ncbi:MAG: GNAT family N-acetyltransferase [Magnetococcales bacterium]|nr:GNAT family N-acetyltransferase [Magnetococcales bacterium]
MTNMLPGNPFLAKGIALRPANPGDKAFLVTLYQGTRDDLWLIDHEEEFIRTLIDQQMHLQTRIYGENHPDAMHLIIEKLGTPIGRVMVSFREREVRVLDISLIPGARRQGFGTAVLRALQQAATQVMTPLTLCVRGQDQTAKTFYHALGFHLAASQPMFDLLIWRPPLPSPQSST